jgi:hypothetical protein
VSALRLRRRSDRAGGILVPNEESEIRAAELHFSDAVEQIVAVTESTGQIRYARRDPVGRFLGFEARGQTAERLDLLPHPEGGWYRRTWTCATELSPAGYNGSRPCATAIYFLLLPGEVSRWHRVRSDELYLWHRGGPLTLRLGGRAAAPADATPASLGADLGSGALPQLLIPAGTWQTATPATDTEVLCSCVVSPGFDFVDFSVTP